MAYQSKAHKMSGYGFHIPDKLAEEMMFASPGAIMGLIGWASHRLAIAKQLDARKTFWGAILAGFVGYIFNILLLHSGLEPTPASIVGAVMGASGNIGLMILFDTYIPEPYRKKKRHKR